MRGMERDGCRGTHPGGIPATGAIFASVCHGCRFFCVVFAKTRVPVFSQRPNQPLMAQSSRKTPPKPALIGLFGQPIPCPGGLEHWVVTGGGRGEGVSCGGFGCGKTCRDFKTKIDRDRSRKIFQSRSRPRSKTEKR